MKNLTVENVYTRQTAKQLVKKHFWKLLGMMMLVGLIIFGLEIGIPCLLALLTNTPIETALGGSSLLYLEIEENEIVNMMPSASLGYTIGSVILYILVILVSGGLSLGLIHSVISLALGKEQVKVSRIFSRMKYCLKSFGLSLWVGFKTFLWALPGFAFLIVAYTFAISSASAEAASALTSAEGSVAVLLSLTPLLSLVIIFALVIPAALRYTLSTYILADKPETGVFDCVRQSKAMMKGHKWQCFKLCIPYILILYGWMLLISLILTIVAGITGEVIVVVIAGCLALLAMIVLVLIYSMRICMASCIFYLKRTGEMPAVPPEEEERIVCWQPGAEPQPAGEPVTSANDEHIAGWQPTESKPDEE